MNAPALIIPVHNRRALTLACLARLHEQYVQGWARIYVVDDGSTDGTAAAITSTFPEVRVCAGNGNLWWTGAIELGMRIAYRDGATAFVWLNDDTLPRPDAVEMLCTRALAASAIVTGECHVPNGGPVVFGGLRQKGLRLELVTCADANPLPVDAACGNFVCIPRCVVDVIGFPDGKGLPHAFGDQDYTLRASRAGVPVLVDPAARAETRPNALANYTSWLLSDIRLRDIWTPLWDQRSYAYAPAHARFLARHFGVRGVLHWLWTVLKRVPVTLARLVIPKRWLRVGWGGRSLVWQNERRLRAALDRADPPRAEP